MPMRILILFVIILSGCASTRPDHLARWWKGNLHTHSLWSDGADFPEMIARWYQDNGYNFLAITEHDMLQQGERWVDINAKDSGWPPRNASARAALPAYRTQFADWVQERTDGQQHLVRLRGLNDYRAKFERPDSFLFIMGEEVTDKGGAHVNAFHLQTAILPRGGESTAARIRNNLQALGSTFAIINHPNFLWALTADDLAAIPDARVFEVYNGHRTVNNTGDATRQSTEQMWDAILTRRHEAGQPPMYGVATDDAHEYRSQGDTTAMPGRGWVMVRADKLTPEHLIGAMRSGDFYASTGVTLSHLERDERGIRLRIAAEPGVSYRTQFIGTLKGSRQSGVILSEAQGNTAEYRFNGSERYVRALVISSRRRIDPLSRMTLELERAWVQPVLR